MDTVSLLVEIEVLKKKMDNAEAFLEELIHYIFVVCKDDDYITPEGICRKLYKYGFIDKKDGEWIADTPQTDEIGDCNICRFAGCSECDDCINGSEWVRMVDYLEDVEDEPQTERRCSDCRFLTYRFNKVWCDIKADNPHDKVCDRFQQKQTDCPWR